MDFKDRKFDIQKLSEREQLMHEVYCLHNVEHVSVPTISKRKSLSCSTVYRILRTFASENPEMAEKMAKQGKDVKPSDYEELLKKVSELESKLKRGRWNLSLRPLRPYSTLPLPFAAHETWGRMRQENTFSRK